jgi:hypothetical protein
VRLALQAHDRSRALLGQVDGVASTLHPEQDEYEGALAEVVRSRAEEGGRLLPGALALVGFHTYAVSAGALSRLQPQTQMVLEVSVAFSALATLLFSILSYGSDSPSRSLESRFNTVNLLFVSGMGALAVGLAGDLWVVAIMQTGSAFVGYLAASLTLLLLFVSRL